MEHCASYYAIAAQMPHIASINAHTDVGRAATPVSTAKHCLWAPVLPATGTRWYSTVILYEPSAWYLFASGLMLSAIILISQSKPLNPWLFTRMRWYELLRSKKRLCRIRGSITSALCVGAVVEDLITRTWNTSGAPASLIPANRSAEPYYG